jgi:hypothetical protein
MKSSKPVWGLRPNLSLINKQTNKQTNNMVNLGAGGGA